MVAGGFFFPEDRELFRPLVDSLLGRDEFGKESTISVSNPAKFGEATERAKGRLNELIGAHGLQVTQIVTPRPQFTEDYEKLIEERNSLGNQLEVIKSNLAAALTSRERKLAEVNREDGPLRIEFCARPDGEQWALDLDDLRAAIDAAVR